jgi:mRNA-degrading endonuclease toxin of MazEF toxin-antitoxin module
MKIGDIVLIPFPFAELTNRKVRPAVVITETEDKYRDLVVSAISAVVHDTISHREIILRPDKINNLISLAQLVRSVSIHFRIHSAPASRDQVGCL